MTKEMRSWDCIVFYDFISDLAEYNVIFLEPRLHVSRPSPLCPAADSYASCSNSATPDRACRLARRPRLGVASIKESHDIHSCCPCCTAHSMTRSLCECISPELHAQGTASPTSLLKDVPLAAAEAPWPLQRHRPMRCCRIKRSKTHREFVLGSVSGLP